MSKERQKTVSDFYGAPLKIGDEVIPMMEEGILLGVTGRISRISFNDHGRSFIDIEDGNGTLLLQRMDSQCYTTESRFDEMECDSVYSLSFYNERGQVITSLPLTNQTDSNYLLPKGVCFIGLDTKHMTTCCDSIESVYDPTGNSSSFLLSELYLFGIKGQVDFKHNEEHDFHYLEMTKTDYYRTSITPKYKLFNDREELTFFVGGLITFFNRANLDSIHNKIEFSRNNNAMAFEVGLIKKLDQECFSNPRLA